MRLLITFGPAWEPIDGARRLTNMSSGRLGTQLADSFLAAGWEVHCLRGEGATYAGQVHTHEVETFTTNDDLAHRFPTVREPIPIGPTPRRLAPSGQPRANRDPKVHFLDEPGRSARPTSRASWVLDSGDLENGRGRNGRLISPISSPNDPIEVVYPETPI